MRFRDGLDDGPGQEDSAVLVPARGDSGDAGGGEGRADTGAIEEVFVKFRLKRNFNIIEMFQNNFLEPG